MIEMTKTTKKTIGILVGSARKKSFSRSIAEAIAAMMPEPYELRFIDLAELTLFNQDYDDENRTPASWIAFRETVASMDGFLFVSPEYNRSIPPLLKNAVDIASRPAGQSLWAGKPGALVGVSPGRMGAFESLNHLRQVLSFLDLRLMQQPEVYISGVAGLLDGADKLSDAGSQQFLRKFADRFAQWLDEHITA